MATISQKFSALGQSIINLINAKTPTATTSVKGLVKPDGSTITVNNGTISAATATANAKGIVKPDGTTITIDNGIISSAGNLPPQAGKNGYLLTTNGTTASWGETTEAHCVIETYTDGFTWYRIWSDGWCEQGGRYTIPTTGAGTITFIKVFKSFAYDLFITKTSTDSSSWNIMTDVSTNGTGSAVVKANLTGYTISGYWMACGYIEVE